MILWKEMYFGKLKTLCESTLKNKAISNLHKLSKCSEEIKIKFLSI